MSISVLSVTVLTCFRGVEEERLEDLRRHPRLGVRLGLDVALGLPSVLYCMLCVLYCMLCVLYCVLYLVYCDRNSARTLATAAARSLPTSLALGLRRK